MTWGRLSSSMTGFAGGAFLRKLRATSPKGIWSGSSWAVARIASRGARRTIRRSSRIPEDRNMTRTDQSLRDHDPRTEFLQQLYGAWDETGMILAKRW